MIVLDTNVLSEALKPSPSDSVLGWLAQQHQSATFLTTVTQAEVLYGIEALPPGKRRERLSRAVENLFALEFEGRILPFDQESARLFAKVVAHREAIGRPITQFDAMIAAICRSRGARIATRNVADFEHCGIPVVNPWKGKQAGF